MAKEFEMFTDPESVKAVLQQRLPALAQGNLLIADCRILHLHCKTYLKKGSRGKSSLAAAYQLDIQNRATGERDPQIIFARIFLGDRSCEEYSRAVQQPLCPTAFGEPLVHLDDLGMVIWTFPNDPVLHSLPSVTNPDEVKNYLPYGSFPAGISAKEIADVKVEIINYRPEIRCTARYRLRCGSATLALFGKTFADGRGREIYQRMERLWQTRRQRAGEFLMPRPLAYNEEVKTIWQKELPGAPLAQIISRDNYRKLIADAAQRLAFIHQSDAPTSSRISLDDHLGEIRKKAAKLSLAFPAEQARLQKMAQTLERNLPRLSPAPDCLVHGDFHLRQLMVHEGRVALLDFDEFATGDPAQDLANFIADLRSHRYDDGFVKAIAATLVEAYSRQTGGHLPADRLAWHSSVQYITRAYRAYLQQKPDLEDRVRYFIALAYQAAPAETLIA
jgi:hypothetical protein